MDALASIFDATSVTNPGAGLDAGRRLNRVGERFADVFGSLANADTAGGSPEIATAKDASTPRDPGSTESLNAPAITTAEDDPALRQAFDDFVGQTLFGQLLAQMRKSVAENPYFGGGIGQSAMQGQLDQALVEQIARASGPTISEPMWKSFQAGKAR